MGWLGRNGLAMDERTKAIRKQMGEAAWADRLSRAEERMAIVDAVQRRLDAGATIEDALSETKAAVSVRTAKRWIKSFAAAGLPGLIDRVGRITTLGHQDPKRVNRPQRQTRGAPSFVKWVGGKQGVIAELVARIPENYSRYLEPMAGSGVLFLAVGPKRAVLADQNAELMGCYQVVRDDLDALLAALARHENTSAHYHQVRAQLPERLSAVEQAARFIFLNKTCFNGMYRVNRDGRFNVPFGRIGHANIRDEVALRRVSAKLQGCELRCGDLLETCADAKAGDFIYFDPPYLAHERARTIRYNRQVFGEQEHRRLASLVRALDERGCLVMVSNSDHPLVRKLYRGFYIESLAVRRRVNANAAQRAGWTELLIRNFGHSRRGRRPRSGLPSARLQQNSDNLE